MLCSYSRKFRDISSQFNEKHNSNKMEKQKKNKNSAIFCIHTMLILFYS